MTKTNINTLLVSAVALTVVGAAGSATASMFDAPTPTSIIKVGTHGCEGKNGCEGKMDEAKDKAAKEKCYGVVKAGQNDCANVAKTHSCAGHAEVDGDAGEWLALPAGVCDKLVGGTTAPKS